MNMAVFEARRHGERGDLVLRGELDLATVRELEEVARDIARPGEDLVLPLSELEFLGLVGLHVIEAIAVQVSPGGRVILDSPSPPVRRLLELMGLGARPTIAARERPQPETLTVGSA